MKISDKFPPLQKPEGAISYGGDIGSDVLEYIARLEERVRDLECAADLLGEMDVFPDMISRIDAIVKERHNEVGSDIDDESPTP